GQIGDLAARPGPHEDTVGQAEPDRAAEIGEAPVDDEPFLPRPGAVETDRQAVEELLRGQRRRECCIRSAAVSLRLGDIAAQLSGPLKVEVAPRPVLRAEAETFIDPGELLPGLPVTRV